MIQNLPKKIPRILLGAGFFLGMAGPWAARGADTNQYLGDQLETTEHLENAVRKVEEPSAFMEWNDPDREMSSNNKTFDHSPSGTPVQEMDSTLTPQNRLRSQEGHIQGTYENSQEYLQTDLAPDFKELSRKNKSNFTLLFGKDSYDYKNSNNSFKRIFRDSKEAEFPGLIRLSSHRFFAHSLLGNVGLGVNLAVGYNSGKGIFLNGEYNDSNITLWTFPLDLAAVYELSFFSFLKVGASGGPSVISLMQNRSDLDSGDKRKNYIQFGTGYFAEVFGRINLNKLFFINPYPLFRKFSVTGIYLTASLRTQHYSHFKSPDLEVSGTSLAFGLTYDVF